MGILEFILKMVAVIAVSVVAYRIVQPVHVVDDRHPVLGLVLELGAIYFIFF